VPTYAGHSIGKWIDENGDGRYDVLDVETRHLSDPRVHDASGLRGGTLRRLVSDRLR